MERFRTVVPSHRLATYLAREVLPSFFWGTPIFLFILLMFQAIRLSEFVVSQQVPLWDVVKMSVFLMLSFLPVAIPVSFLFSVLLGISRANSEGEILALQSNGFSLVQVYSPVAWFSLLITGVCLYTSLYTVPKGNRAFELLINRLRNERIIAALKPGVFLEGFYGLVLFAEQINPVRSEMSKVFLYDEREEKFPLFITAESGMLKTAPDKSLLTLRLTNGTILVERAEEKAPQQKIGFDVYDINLDLGPAGDMWRDYTPPSLDLPHLLQKQRESIPDTPWNRILKVELHRRLSLSFSCVVFSALGFFISILSQRGIRSTAILLCLFVGVVYWLGYVAANATALSGAIPVWLALWLPNFIFLGFSYWCYRRYQRGS